MTTEEKAIQTELDAVYAKLEQLAQRAKKLKRPNTANNIGDAMDFVEFSAVLIQNGDKAPVSSGADSE